ncbi:tRNA(m(1)G37)methyltransferase, partial [Podochytrium sp. JEL0797]
MIIAPPANKSLTVLSSEAKASLFTLVLELVALKVPQTSCAKAMQTLPPHLLDVPRLRSIVACDSDKGKRLVLLHPDIGSPLAMPQTVKDFAAEANAEIIPAYPLKLAYDYWTADQILRSIIPDHLNVPSSFELIGHIAHLNLRDELLPYKTIVGQVLLDKNQYIRTVVNKTSTIDHTFRFFQMELLAGEPNLHATLKESNCTFSFDFSKVYWNSCLQTEHERIVGSFFGRGEAVCDVMAGVGPFAVPAGKNRGCLVFANDLNPESWRWLKVNVEGNKLGHLVRPYNMDGREFIRSSLVDLNNPEITAEMKKLAPVVVVRKSSKEGKKGKGKKQDSTASVPVDGTSSADSKLPVGDVAEAAVAKVAASVVVDVVEEPSFRIFNHYVMNLPATALEFLDAFWGLLHGHESDVPPEKLPMIHVHCFSTVIDDLEGDVLKRAETHLGCSIPPENIVKIHRVRDVAPKKEMMCLSFRLPAEAAFGEPKEADAKL